jgi:hypothetical protein
MKPGNENKRDKLHDVAKAYEANGWHRIGLWIPFARSYWMRKGQYVVKFRVGLFSGEVNDIDIFTQILES